MTLVVDYNIITDEAPTQGRPLNLKITSASLSQPIVRASYIG